MKATTSLKAVLSCFFLTGAFTVLSQSGFAQNKTLKGEILDLSCYMSSGAMGKGHQMCAQGCLDKGLPAGILNKSDGKVYLLVEDHKNEDAYKQAIKHAADNIEVSGKVIDKNGMQSIVVETVKVEG
ncbi:MAG: hypothetical protein JST21_06995 [Bacteroidetes bacterium]|nr:hypothetical protein [Bacteroidota bacterium]